MQRCLNQLEGSKKKSLHSPDPLKKKKKKGNLSVVAPSGVNSPPPPASSQDERMHASERETEGAERAAMVELSHSWCAN